MAYEEPAYTVVERREHFELRDYSPTLVAYTTVSADFDDAGNQAFRILADYIFGNNQSRTSIEMTSPVNSTASEKMEMTAPVNMSGAPGRYEYQFVLPARYSLESAPRPNDDRVQLRMLPARRYAALRYSGSWSEERYQQKLAELRAALAADGVNEVGEPIFARYNSPFTLWFLRRNEILIEVRR